MQTDVKYKIPNNGSSRKCKLCNLILEQYIVQCPSSVVLYSCTFFSYEPFLSSTNKCIVMIFRSLVNLIVVTKQFNFNLQTLQIISRLFR